MSVRSLSRAVSLCISASLTLAPANTQLNCVATTSVFIDLSGFVRIPDEIEYTVVIRPTATILSAAMIHATWLLIPAIVIVVLFGSFIWYRRRIVHLESRLSDERQTSQANRELREVLQDRFSRLQRMESLGMLAGGVAHDFNNLLVGVICNAEIVESHEDTLSEFSKKRIQQIISSAEQAAHLSRQMLAYAGKSKISRKKLDINQLTNDMSRILMATAGPGIKLVLETDSESAAAEVDETQMEQILLNLVSNARQALQHKGTIIVRTGREFITDVKSDEELLGTRDTGGAFVYIEVEDFGPGISPNNLKQIFEPFYSVSDGGRGLGLAVVIGIVNSHKGLIRVRSVLGKGTCFRVLIPQVDQVCDVEQPSLIGEHSAVDPKNTSKRLGTILVADDEPTILEFAETHLNMQGWNVVTADSGRQAIEIVNEKNNDLDCILLDVRMPDLGADDVLAALDGHETSIPIILMSGYSETQLNKYLSNKQVGTILAKPFRSIDLTKAIDVAVGGEQKSTQRRMIVDADQAKSVGQN